MGVTGIDISLTDIAEDTSYFTNSDTLYSFLIDDSGKEFHVFFIALCVNTFSIVLKRPVFNNFEAAQFVPKIWQFG